MTRERYFEMQEQMGHEIKPEEMPPDWEDFPSEVNDAAVIFNYLGDRVYPDIGYVGKDYTNLPILLDIYGIEDPSFTIDILNNLDQRAIKESSEHLKREHEKLKRKHSGRK